MDCRKIEKCDFKRRLGSNLLDVINTKQQIRIGLIKGLFEGENMQSEHYVLGYRIDLHFHDYRLAIEVDESDHCDRAIKYEKERERRLKEELNSVFIKINPDDDNINCIKVINKIHRHRNKSTREMNKKET